MDLIAKLTNELCAVTAHNTAVTLNLSIPHSQAQSFVCGSEKRNRVPVSAIQKIFDSHGIFIPKENRAFPTHIADGIFVETAVKEIIEKALDVQLDQETTLEYMRLLRELGELVLLRLNT